MKRLVEEQGGRLNAAIYVVGWTVFLPVALLLRLVFFGRFTDRETFLDRIRDKVVGN